MPWLPHRYGHMVQEYYVARLREVRGQRQAERDRITTRAGALRLQKEVRAKWRKAFAPIPKKTPLNPRITGRIETRRFTVEKLLLESRPGFLVSANLYVPRGLTRPAPCVLGVLGHSQSGKAEPVYQAYVQGLVSKGFVVLIYDPIGQGERVQYPNEAGVPSLGLCAEHNMVGHQQALLGEWFGTWRTWDGVRCLDYLLGRPETDRTRVGVTGNSGGGTLTSWLCAIDDRFTMAAPSCWITTLLSNMENELPADIEQIAPEALAMGLDEIDCFTAFAPRPLILLTQQKDFFDQRGSRLAYQELRRIYRLLGAEKNLRFHTGPTRHGYSIHNREAMYAFFTKHAGGPVSGKEPRIRPLEADQLHAAKAGRVRTSGSKRVFDFTRAVAEEVAAKRGRIPAKKLPGILRRLLAMPKRTGTPHHRILRHYGDGQMVWQGYALETEPGIQTIVTMLCPDGNQFQVPTEQRCTLLVPHLGAYEDLAETRVRKSLPARDRILGVDPRGIGQSLPHGCDRGGFFAPYDSDYFYDAHGIMLDEPYLGRRVFDVLRTLDWLRGCGYEQIHLVGRGMGAVTALLAAVLEPRVAKLTLMNGLLSYHELTQVPIHRWPASAQVRGALLKFDLPDCYRAVAKKLTLVEPWSARMRRIPAAKARARVRELGLPARVLKKG